MNKIIIPRRKLLIVSAISLLPTEVRAQLLQLGVGGGGVAPSLLLDTVTGAIGAYSTRKLRTAYAGQCVNIRRSSDNATQDIGFVSGDFDATSFSSFIGGGSGFVTKWYDQSGAALDISQATTTQQPQLVLAVQNSRAIVRFVRANITELDSAGTVTQAQPFTAAAVAARRTGSGNFNSIFGNPGFTIGMDFRGVATDIEFYSSSFVFAVGATETSFHSLVGLFNGASSVIAINGSETVLSPGTVGLSSIISVGGFNNTAGQAADSDMGEFILWNSGLNLSQRNTVHSNQSTWWGTP